MLTCNVVWTGTSITAENHEPGNGYVSLTQTAFPALESHNIAVPSSTLDSEGQGASADALFNSAKQVNICFVEFGVNDGVSVPVDTFKNTLATYCAARRTAGFKVIVATMLPCGSYDSVAFRDSLNTYIRATSTFWDRLADFGNLSSTMGAEAAKNDTNLYSDSVHPTVLGYTYLAPIVQAAISSLASSSDARGLRALRVA
jgi:lysophospholipase L1-like esterase